MHPKGGKVRQSRFCRTNVAIDRDRAWDPESEPFDGSLIDKTLEIGETDHTNLTNLGKLTYLKGLAETPSGQRAVSISIYFDLTGPPVRFLRLRLRQVLVGRERVLFVCWREGVFIKSQITNLSCG